MTERADTQGVGAAGVACRIESRRMRRCGFMRDFMKYLVKRRASWAGPPELREPSPH